MIVENLREDIADAISQGTYEVKISVDVLTGLLDLLDKLTDEKTLLYAETLTLKAELKDAWYQCNTEREARAQLRDSMARIREILLEGKWLT